MRKLPRIPQKVRPTFGDLTSLKLKRVMPAPGRKLKPILTQSAVDFMRKSGVRPYGFGEMPKPAMKLPSFQKRKPKKRYL